MSAASAVALSLFLPAILFSSFSTAYEACTGKQQEYYGNDTLVFAYKFWASYIYGAVPLLVSFGCTWLYLTSPSSFSKRDVDFHRIVGIYYVTRLITNLVCILIELAFFLHRTLYPAPSPCTPLPLYPFTLYPVPCTL